MQPEYLNDLEKSLINTFNSNQPMREAVRKVLLATIYHQGTAVAGEKPTEFNFAFNIVNGEGKSDEQIGQELRASITALGYLKSGFERLDEIKVNEPAVTKKTNPAT
jgi:hypothetical protein